MTFKFLFLIRLLFRFVLLRFISLSICCLVLPRFLFVSHQKSAVSFEAKQVKQALCFVPKRKEFYSFSLSFALTKHEERALPTREIFY
jgi:hypothetical protein